MSCCELVLPAGLPQRDEVRKRLRNALVAAGELPCWREAHPRPGRLARWFRRQVPPEIRWEGRRVWGGGRSTVLPPVEELTRALCLAKESPARRRFRLPALATMLPALGLALLPKCPICWAALMAAMGVAGLSSLPFQPWLSPSLGALLVVSLILLRVGGRGASWGPFWLGAAGAALTLIARFVLTSESAGVAGVALVGASAIWSAVARNARSFRPI